MRHTRRVVDFPLAGRSIVEVDVLENSIRMDNNQRRMNGSLNIDEKR